MTKASADLFIGRQVKRAAAAGFSFGHWVSPSDDEEVQEHEHGEAHFILVTAGDFVTGAEGHRRCERSLIYNPPGTRHRDRFRRGGAFFAVSIPGISLAAAQEHSLPSLPTIVEGHSLSAIQRLMRECADWDADSELSAEATCLELLSAVGRKQVDDACAPAWLKKARDLLRETRGRPPTVSAISAAVQVHPIHLTRTFRRFFGCTPGEYLRATRLTRAANLLVSTRLTPTEIALACGFADQSHFTHSFRRIYPVSPDCFRRMVA